MINMEDKQWILDNLFYIFLVNSMSILAFAMSATLPPNASFFKVALTVGIFLIPLSLLSSLFQLDNSRGKTT